MFKQNNYEKALRIADKGLCMGRIDESSAPLRQLAWMIHEQLPSTSSENAIHPGFCFNKTSHSPVLVPLPNSFPIEECHDDDECCFERIVSAVNNETPILIRKHASNMPAVQKWTFPFLLQQLHSRTFPVEIGTKYSDEDWSQKMMTFRNFILNSENEQLYLAQHRLFDQVPHLKHDVCIPDVCFGESTNDENVDMNMWIGPSNTVSPLHTDPRKNMFVQIHGTKLFRMVSPNDTESVYPFDGMLSNTSQVDVDNPDLSEFPNFSKVRVLDAVVNAGDALFIPEKWWHFVRSATPSISISFWFD
uniref:JmjC domain-containing protein n=2 Tax=Caenorhabditis tropicalis TaxID=1561998 RepID=A0A1I7SZY9_9PELO